MKVLKVLKVTADDVDNLVNVEKKVVVGTKVVLVHKVTLVNKDRVAHKAMLDHKANVENQGKMVYLVATAKTVGVVVVVTKAPKPIWTTLLTHLVLQEVH